MSFNFQSVAALVVVALAATGLIVRAVRQRHKPGCGGGCACPTEKLKR